MWHTIFIGVLHKFTGAELFRVESPTGDAILKQLWHHSDAIMCCSVKANASPLFTFANQAGLDVLETTLVAVQDIMLDKVIDEVGRKILCSEFSKIMQQGFAYLPADRILLDDDEDIRSVSWCWEYPGACNITLPSETRNLFKSIYIAKIADFDIPISP